MNIRSDAPMQRQSGAPTGRLFVTGEPQQHNTPPFTVPDPSPGISGERSAVAPLSERSSAIPSGDHPGDPSQKQAEHVRREQYLNQILRTISSTVDPLTVFHTVLEQVIDVLHADGGAILLLDSSGTQFDIQHAINLPPASSEPALSPLAQQVIASGTALNTDAYPTHPLALPELVAYGVRTALNAPVQSATQVLGLISVIRLRNEPFSDRDLALLETIGRQSGIALQHAWLYQAAQLQNAELEALHETMADISTELELSRLLSAIMQRALQLIGGDFGTISLYEPRLNRLRVVLSANYNRNYYGLLIAPGDGASGTVALLREPMIVSNYPAWSGRMEAFVQEGVQNVIVTPMMAGSQLIGVLNIGSRDAQRSFHERDLNLLNRFGQQATIAIQNARLYQDAVRSAERQHILYQASKRIGSSLRLSELYEIIHRSVRDLIPCDGFVISLLNEIDHEITDVYIADDQRRYPPIDYPMLERVAGRVIANRHSLRIDHPDHLKLHGIEPAYLGDGETPARAILAASLRRGDRVFGALSVLSATPHAYADADQEALELLSSSIAIAVDNARLFSRIEELATIDDLTRIANRRYFLELAEYEMERSQRYGRALAVVVLDVDHFKRVNDTYKHHTGDIVLQVIAARCRACLREVDLIGRYGGEEFVVLLPETDLPGARAVAERLRESIGDAPIPTDQALISVTISLGVAGFLPNDPADLKTLLRRADHALYAAKHSGRNRVWVWEGEREESRLV